MLTLKSMSALLKQLHCLGSKAIGWMQSLEQTLMQVIDQLTQRLSQVEDGVAK